MAAYRDEVDEMAKNFIDYDITYVQQDNMVVDTLSKLGSSRKATPPGVFLEHLCVLKGHFPNKCILVFVNNIW
jgi:hypothetical protein